MGDIEERNEKMKKIIALFFLLLAASACSTDRKVDNTNKITNRNDIVSFETEETFDNPESSEYEELHEQELLRTDIIPLCGEYVELNVPTNFRYQHVLSFEDNIVFYSENLDEKLLNQGFSDFEKSDLVLVLGSSLTVQPAASLPMAAKYGGADIVIVNNQPTNLDSSAVLKFDDLKAVFDYLEKVL